MANTTEPILADNPMSGYCSFETVNDIRPCDQIRIGSNAPPDHFYEIISVRRDDPEKSVQIYDHQSNELSLKSKTEVKEILKSDDSYLWSILCRELIPIETASGKDCLAVYIYAIESHLLDNNRGLFVGMDLSNNFPPKQIANFSESDVYPTFEEIRSDLNNSSGVFEEIIETLSGDIYQLLNCTISAAEYNAENLFGTQTDSTYTAEMKSQLDESAQHIQKTSDKSNIVYD